MSLRIRVSTKASTFEERKQQYLQQGYRIEDECPTPINGMCSFVVVKDEPLPDPFEYVRN
jgi:hypothetical protein